MGIKGSQKGEEGPIQPRQPERKRACSGYGDKHRGAVGTGQCKWPVICGPEKRGQAGGSSSFFNCPPALCAWLPSGFMEQRTRTKRHLGLPPQRGCPLHTSGRITSICQNIPYQEHSTLRIHSAVRKILSS